MKKRETVVINKFGSTKARMQKLSSHHTKILIFLFPITLLLIFLSVKVASPDTYILLLQEDSAIEYTQAFFYFLSSIISLLISIRFLKNELTLHGVLYGILAVGLLFIAIEEISWGQRILDIETPGFFDRHNTQNEISLHNLPGGRYVAYMLFVLTGLYGTFAWSFARLFVSSEETKSSHIVNYIVPDWFISSYFFSSLLICIFIVLKWSAADIGIADSRIWVFVEWRDEEAVELFLSIGLLSFVLVNHTKLRICLPSPQLGRRKATKRN